MWEDNRLLCFGIACESFDSSIVELVVNSDVPLDLLITHLESPKSHSFTLQSLSIKIFAGLISRCITPEVCMKFIAHSKLYVIITI